jgi:hypothetical protein
MDQDRLRRCGGPHGGLRLPAGPIPLAARGLTAVLTRAGLGLRGCLHAAKFVSAKDYGLKAERDGWTGKLAA